MNILAKNLVGFVLPPATGGEFENVTFANGTNVKSGYTPLTFTAYNNTQYKIVTDKHFNQYYFDHWDGGSKSTTRYITPVSNMNLFVYYTQPVTLIVKTVNSTGYPITGYFIQLYNSTSGSQISSGYSPYNVTIATNKTYSVGANSFNGVNFNHWDLGYTNPTRTLGSLTLVKDIITAYYTP